MYFLYFPEILSRKPEKMKGLGKNTKNTSEKIPRNAEKLPRTSRVVPRKPREAREKNIFKNIFKYQEKHGTE
jgi:hypothetical protein